VRYLFLLFLGGCTLTGDEAHDWRVITIELECDAGCTMHFNGRKIYEGTTRTMEIDE